MKNNDKKNEQLGMPHGTAQGKLRKSILFTLLKKHGENICHQCKEEISSVDELSIEHKVPWLNSPNPLELFFDVENIAFSHLNCNVGARKKPDSRHGSNRKYTVYGCRCDLCKEAHALVARRFRSKNKMESLPSGNGNSLLS